MGALNIGTYVLEDAITGEVYHNMTCKMIAEAIDVCIHTVKRHCVSGRPIQGRYYIHQPNSYISRDFTRYYPDEWIRAFSIEWKEMQRLFGVGVIQ